MLRSDHPAPIRHCGQHDIRRVIVPSTMRGKMETPSDSTPCWAELDTPRPSASCAKAPIDTRMVLGHLRLGGQHEENGESPGSMTRSPLRRL